MQTSRTDRVPGRQLDVRLPEKETDTERARQHEAAGGLCAARCLKFNGSPDEYTFRSLLRLVFLFAHVRVAQFPQLFE